MVMAFLLAAMRVIASAIPIQSSWKHAKDRAHRGKRRGGLSRLQLLFKSNLGPIWVDWLPNTDLALRMRIS
jgi:hypothetical protein